MTRKQKVRGPTKIKMTRDMPPTLTTNIAIPNNRKEKRFIDKENKKRK